MQAFIDWRQPRSDDAALTLLRDRHTERLLCALNQEINRIREEESAPRRPRRTRPPPPAVASTTAGGAPEPVQYLSTPWTMKKWMVGAGPVSSMKSPGSNTE